MMRLLGILLITGFFCVGCNPPAGEPDSGDTSDTNSTTPAATNDTLPPPTTKASPEEKPAPPAEAPAEEPKAESLNGVDPAAAAQPTPADSVKGLLDDGSTEEKPAPESGAEMKKPEATETVSVAASGPVEMKLTPDNTLIQFVGTHVGDDPKPRTGNFGKFSGTAKADGDKLTSVEVTIETASLDAGIPDLTNHLKNADFFDVRQHPKATFKTTKIENGDDGTKITGDLTMLGNTKSITFPAKVTVGKDVKLEAEFVIDRLEFGMDYSPDKVHKDVTMTIKVGK